MNKDYEKILDFIYNHQPVPDDIRIAIRDWMLQHEDDPELSSSMLSIWNNEFGKNSGTFDPMALTRLLNDISSNGTKVRKTRKFNISKLIRYAAVVAAVCLTSIVTYVSTKSNEDKETILITAKGSTGEFTLPDGTNVRLNSDTRLTYDSKSFMSDGKRRVSVEGEAFFDVTKDAGNPFVVQLTDMEVEVLGTSFDVRNYSFSSKEEVVLLTGKVKVEGKDIKKPVTIYPDQRFVLNRANGDCNVEKTAAINYCRWIEPRLKLENEPLGDILITLSRKYSVELEIEKNVDLNKRISLTLQNDALEDLMPVISYLTDINYRVENNILYISNLNFKE